MDLLKPSAPLPALWWNWAQDIAPARQLYPMWLYAQSFPMFKWWHSMGFFTGLFCPFSTGFILPLCKSSQMIDRLAHCPLVHQVGLEPRHQTTRQTSTTNLYLQLQFCFFNLHLGCFITKDYILPQIPPQRSLRRISDWLCLKMNSLFSILHLFFLWILYCG